MQQYFVEGFLTWDFMNFMTFLPHALLVINGFLCPHFNCKIVSTLQLDKERDMLAPYYFPMIVLTFLVTLACMCMVGLMQLNAGMNIWSFVAMIFIYTSWLMSELSILSFLVTLGSMASAIKNYNTICLNAISVEKTQEFRKLYSIFQKLLDLPMFIFFSSNTVFGVLQIYQLISSRGMNDTCLKSS